nr:MAG TPA: hypothetical protein [Caudoviricetes sp.]
MCSGLKSRAFKAHEARQGRRVPKARRANAVPLVNAAR